MKHSKINKSYICFLALFAIVVGLFTSCKDEWDVDTKSEFGTASTTSLQSKIDEVEKYLATAVEGVNEGNHPPGTIAKMQEVVDNAKKVISKGLNQALTDRALEILVDKYKAFLEDVVAPANPWVQQSNGTYILLGDNVEGGGVEGNIKKLTKNSFTVEVKVFPISLKQAGYSNVLFSNAMGEGGANDRGWNVRYFSDGHMEFIVGGTNVGWKQASTAAGVLKASTWQHVSFTVTGEEQKLYVDGVEVASQKEEYKDSDDKYPITIGDSFAWKERTINGMVKDFRFWAKVLSESEINDNKNASLVGNESGLEIYFPFGANLGKEFPDISGKYKATFVNDVIWVPGGNIAGLEVDYSALELAINQGQKIIGTGNEGTEDGNYPVGTKEYLKKLIDGAKKLIDDKASQLDVDNMVEYLTKRLGLIEKNLVADANGIYIDAQDPDATGLRITSPYSPTGSFTIELDVNIESFKSACCAQGNIFGNGSYGLMYGAYDNPDSIDQLSSVGSLYFYIRNNGGYEGPRSKAFAIKSNAWYHIGLVYDKTNSTSYIYVDGQEVARHVGRAVPDAVDWGETWLGNAWVKMDGRVKNFRTWSVAKAPSELNAAIQGNEPNLEVYFPLDKVAGIVFKDVTGNYEGELRGVVWDTSK